MQPIVFAAALAFLGAVLTATSDAAPLQRNAGAIASSDISAQSRSRRARPQVRVTPRYPYRSYNTIYPPPYTYEYPGPNAVRQCTDRYVIEHRPSGTVVVPRMRCWWVPG